MLIFVSYELKQIYLKGGTVEKCLKRDLYIQQEQHVNNFQLGSNFDTIRFTQNYLVTTKPPNGRKSENKCKDVHQAIAIAGDCVGWRISYDS